LIEEEHGAGGADDNEILASIVIDVDEECAGGVVEDADARGFGDVFERSVAAIAV
jgi:hypothetical protein